MASEPYATNSVFDDGNHHQHKRHTLPRVTAVTRRSYETEGGEVRSTCEACKRETIKKGGAEAGGEQNERGL